MKTIRTILLALAVSFFGVGVLNSIDAFADETISAVGVQVSPSIQRTGSIDPGVKYSNKIAVSNVGDKAVDFHMSVEPFSVENITYAPIYSVVNAYTQITKWITFNDFKTHLEPGEMSEVIYTVDVPMDVPGGGQYAVIFAEMDEDQAEGESIKKIAKAGTILVARVNGDTRETGKISETTLPRFLLAPPVVASAVFENTGNVDATAKMTLKIENYISGSVVYDGTSEPLEKTILPGTTRKLEITAENVPRLGILKATLTTEFLGDAEIKTRVIFIFPIWFIGLIALIILIIVVRIGLKRRENRRTRAHSRNATGSSENFNL